MGVHRRGYRVAALQARPAAIGGRDRRARALDRREPRGGRASAQGSGGTGISVALDHGPRAVDRIDTIRDVSLELDRRTLSVLLGPTPLGKTSLLMLLAGLDRPTSGR